MLAKSVPLRPTPRLYLATPVVDDPARIMTPLADALASADVAAVLMRLSPSDPAGGKTRDPRATRGSRRMEPRGIEPRFAECDSAVIPLDHGPGLNATL